MLRAATKRHFWTALKQALRRKGFVPMIKIDRFRKEDIPVYEKRLEEYSQRQLPFLALKVKDRKYDSDTVQAIRDFVQRFKGAS